MSWFLLAFHRSKQDLLEFRRFSDQEKATAWEGRSELIRQYLAQPDIEVVLLGARSEGELRFNHNRYFVNAPAA